MNFWILAFSTNFCPFKTKLSGNTVSHKLQVFKNSPKLTIFLHFQLTFVYSKCKLSSLRSQCWMRLVLWFSNTVQIIEFLCQKSRLTNFPLKLNFWTKNGGLEKCDTMDKNHKKKITGFLGYFLSTVFWCNALQFCSTEQGEISLRWLGKSF